MISAGCRHCIHYLNDAKCLAFERIPEKIFLGEIEHLSVLTGQKEDFIFMEDNAT